MSTDESDIATAAALLKRLTEPPARLVTLTKNVAAAEKVYRGDAT